MCTHVICTYNYVYVETFVHKKINNIIINKISNKNLFFFLKNFFIGYDRIKKIENRLKNRIN